MIPRYTRDEIASVWSDETKYRIWFEIESHACDAMAECGLIPDEAARIIREKGTAATFDVARIEEIERDVKHDVIAFLTHLSELIGEEARYIHRGLTSSDILDTCFSVQLRRCSDILLDDISDLLSVLKKRAYEHKDTLTIGRSHGIHAEPTTFGLKLAQAYAEFSRHYDRLILARDEISTCALSGAVGTFAHIDPYIESYVADRLGLRVEPISTQIIPRDRHGVFFSTLGVIASSLERLSVEVRHLQRTEVGEASEYFSSLQKGSSAMPHKNNPILSENVTGLARLIRSSVIPALENVALWHERDISHSSVERGIGPDVTVTLDFALRRMSLIMEKLIVYPDVMEKNASLLGGVIFSQSLLLGLVDAGMSREDAYRHVQKHALASWMSRESGAAVDAHDFADRIKGDEEIGAYMSAERIDDALDVRRHLRHVDMIFDRVFGKEADNL